MQTLILVLTLYFRNLQSEIYYPFPVKSHCRFYSFDQTAMHEFINKIGQISI